MVSFDGRNDLPTTVLDSLPLGVTVQNKRFQLLYQNDFSKKLLNLNGTKVCFQRFAKYEDYGDTQCKDCPLLMTSIDKKPHGILRRMIDPITDEEVYFNIKHQPILNQDGDFDKFIEIINQVDQKMIKGILNSPEDINPKEEIHFAISNFGDFGGEVQHYSSFDEFQSDIDTENFILKLSQFWFMAISQGENWPNGLFGPLPVFDHDLYDSYAFSFRKNNPNLKDKRFSGQDVGMLIIITRKTNRNFQRKRLKIFHLLNKLIGDTETIAKLSTIGFENLRELIIKIQEENLLPLELEILQE